MLDTYTADTFVFAVNDSSEALAGGLRQQPAQEHGERIAGDVLESDTLNTVVRKDFGEVGCEASEQHLWHLEGLGCCFGAEADVNKVDGLLL